MSEQQSTSGRMDVLDVWDDDMPPGEADMPPGGWVCAACGISTETEPCPDHQPTAYQTWTAWLDWLDEGKEPDHD